MIKKWFEEKDLSISWPPSDTAADLSLRHSRSIQIYSDLFRLAAVVSIHLLGLIYHRHSAVFGTPWRPAKAARGGGGGVAGGLRGDFFFLVRFT